LSEKWLEINDLISAKRSFDGITFSLSQAESNKTKEEAIKLD
jgi:hypothetical protein